MSNGNTTPGAVPWWKDKAILLALTPIVATLLKIVQINWGPWIAAHTGLAINTWKAEDVLSYVGGAGSVIAGVYFVRRRIAHGKDPANPAPLVVGGAISQALIGATPPPPAPDLAEITKPTAPAVGVHTMTDEELLALIQSRMKVKAQTTAAPEVT